MATLVIIMDPIETKNQLWRTCTNSNSYRLRPGGTPRLQTSEAEFDSLATCYSGRWPSGKAADCNPATAGSIPALPSKVVRPKILPRIGEIGLMPG